MRTLWFRTGILALALSAVPAVAFEVPVNDGFVTDSAGILSAEEEAFLEQILTNYQRETGNEIAILIVETMSGDSIFDAAVETHRNWGVGTEEHDNGILLLVSYADRELFLSVGYGLEGAVPDLVAKGIVDQDITPAFRDGNFAEGLEQGIDALTKHIGGEYTAQRYEEQGNPPWIFLFYVAFIFFELIGSFFAKSKSWWMGGILGAGFGVIAVVITGWWLSIPLLTVLGLIFDYIMSKRGPRRRGKGGPLFWMGGGRGGRGGGGFGGFGGGSTGGGGAGGKW